MNREPEDTTTPSEGGDNVVRLPRDWLGPRDELVPLRRTVAASASPGAPPGADDFWGEDSAALQDPWQAPGAPEAAGVLNRRPRVRWRPAVPMPFASLLGAATLRRCLVASLAVVGALAAVAIAVGYASSGAPRARSAHQLAALTAQRKPATGHAHATQVITDHKARAHPRARHPRVVPRPARRRVIRKHAASTTGTVTAAAASTPSPGSSSQGQGTSTVVANPTPQHDDSTVSASQSSAGHPTGAGAPFAPGYIP